ncbi:tRNA (N6-threonylcarbamoyladenosine(37)-N6)-methyltransferase TrmO [Rhodanobacter aciditrophus]|uniref:tRNA (N6-threonylcarbamoyladenosine(37)-N6)-methyltransferase TrmO n=1 Tax=Rhodanobacter aciditrophus TaxID=1623218 RepID=UPI003CFA1533
MSEPIVLQVVGRLRSDLGATDAAPHQGDEGAPDAWLVLEAGYADALAGVVAGDSLVVLTWLHQARRDMLKVRPRGDPDAAWTGVFRTRSPHRPNPIGIHPVRVRAVDGRRLLIGPIEAIDGTPVVDIKVELGPVGER